MCVTIFTQLSCRVVPPHVHIPPVSICPFETQRNGAPTPVTPFDLFCGPCMWAKSEHDCFFCLSMSNEGVARYREHRDDTSVQETCLASLGDLVVHHEVVHRYPPVPFPCFFWSSLLSFLVFFFARLSDVLCSSDDATLAHLAGCLARIPATAASTLFDCMARHVGVPAIQAKGCRVLAALATLHGHTPRHLVCDTHTASKQQYHNGVVFFL